MRRPWIFAVGIASTAAVLACGSLLGVQEIHFEEGDAATDGGGTPKEAGQCSFSDDCPSIATTPANCAQAECLSGKCVYHARDTDGDGHRAANCKGPSGIALATGDDCDDNNGFLFPGSAGVECSAASNGNPIAFPGGVPKGACKYGTKACLGDGGVSPCQGAIGPAPETVCTQGIDENCDGNPLDGCTCTPGDVSPCGSSATPPCKPGAATCQANGTYGPCVGNIEPSARQCNSNVDNDCNGKIDSSEPACQCAGGFTPSQTRPCNTHPGQDGVGACKSGSQTCTPSGGTASWAGCSGDVGPTTEQCTGTDYDCNGIPGVDEPADPTPPGTANCAHIYRCSDPGGVRGYPRGPVYYRTGIGFTQYSGGGTEWTGYALQGRWSTNTYPAGWSRLARNAATGMTLGPYDLGSSCGTVDEVLFPLGPPGEFFTAPP